MKAGGPQFSGLFKGTKLLFDDDFLELDYNSCWPDTQIFDPEDMEYEKNRCFYFDSDSKIQKDDFGKLTFSVMEYSRSNNKIKHFVYPDGTVDLTDNAFKD